MPLAIVEPGRTVRIVTVKAEGWLQTRLSAMGLLPGEEIEVLGNSSRGPFLVAVKGSRIMLSRIVALGILVA